MCSLNLVIFCFVASDWHKPLIEAFFSNIYPSFPVITRDAFQPIHHRVASQGFHSDAEYALYLAVLSLGRFLLDLTTSSAAIESEDGLDGMEYFSAAYQILLSQ